MSGSAQIAFFTVLGGLAIPAYPASLVDMPPRAEQNFSTQWLYVARDVPNGEQPDLKDDGSPG